MSSQETGGPAFPFVVPDNIFLWKEGMALRDYFAAKAMQGVLSDPEVDPSTFEECEQLAKGMYMMADAMLKAREQ